MARPTKPPRLIRRKDDDRWVIVFRGKQYKTGARGRAGEEAAQKALARFHLETYLQFPKGPEPLRSMPIDTVLTHYLENPPPGIIDLERQTYAVERLMEFWTNKTCADISERTCNAYKNTRKSASTARRELNTLRAALIRAAKARLIEAAPAVWLPPEADPSPTWLTRAEVARLLWQLWRRKETRHSARLVQLMFYTGSRPGTVARTTWVKTAAAPWVDLQNGIWWRSGAAEPKTKKMRQPHRIPRPLQMQLEIMYRAMERREHAGAPAQTYIVEHWRNPGRPIRDIGGSLRTACKRAKIDKEITPHTMKHTAITNAIISGMSMTDAASYFSTTVETIEKVYWHQSPFHQAEAAEIMGQPGKRQRNARK